ISLGLHCNPLALAGMLGNFRQTLGGNCQLPGDAFRINTAPFDFAQGEVLMSERAGRLLIVAEARLQYAVHHQIRIAPDGGSEVAVAVRCKTEMPYVVGGILGLSHAA